MNFDKILGLKEKNIVCEYLKKLFKKEGLEIVEENFLKPWGGYFKFKEKNVEKFIGKFYGKDFAIDKKYLKLKLDPKILAVAPKQRLSWQYHFRRAEYWKIIGGEVEIMESEIDEIPEKGKIYKAGDLIKLEEEIRHRLIGLDNWGMVAEIWVHTDTKNPSDEDDIVRVEDDYNRK